MGGKGLRDDPSRRLFVYAGVLAFVAFFLFLDFLVGTITFREFFVLVSFAAGVFLAIEAFLRLFS